MLLPALRFTPAASRTVTVSEARLRTLLPRWLSEKIPKGFGNFFPKSSTSGAGKRAGSNHGKRNGGGEDPEGGGSQEQLTQGALMLVGSLSLLYLLNRNSSESERSISWQEFKTDLLSAGLVESLLVVNKTTARVKLYSRSNDWNDSAIVFSIGSIENFERKLENAQRDLGISDEEFVPVTYTTETHWTTVAGRVAPTVLMIAFWIAIIRMGSSMSGGGKSPFGGGGGPMSNIFNIGKAAPATKAETVAVKFKDVAGCDEAKAEIVEFVQFLKEPSRFTKLGAKIPKGALLVGPPGTGKTLLAKATAGEADVPFFSMSGSDFIEMFVGVGPSRVRDLFKKAREAAPCIVFIDEIDAVARKRSQGGFGGGGNDERENTLNQLLVEMDGFKTSEGVVVLAGTNRSDVLDPAILRPGRFDRQIQVDNPDIQGRTDIFSIYLKKLTLDESTRTLEQYAQRLAALSPGMSGADIANVCNEAAIIGARRAAESVSMDDFDSAIDRVIGGMEKKGKIISKEERKTIAFHEAGHAIAGWLLEHADPLLKVTIIPRSSGALGFAQYLPKEVALHTKEQLRDMMCMALGGRAAEDIAFGKVTTGASDDLRRVTQIATSMVQIYGMSEKLGNVSYPPSGNEMEMTKPYSESTGQVIDEEVKNLIDAMYTRVHTLLQDNFDKVTSVGNLLLEKETISHDDVIELVGARPFPMDTNYAEYISQKAETSDEQGETEGKEIETMHLSADGVETVTYKK